MIHRLTDFKSIVVAVVCLMPLPSCGDVFVDFSEDSSGVTATLSGSYELTAIVRPIGRVGPFTPALGGRPNFGYLAISGSPDIDARTYMVVKSENPASSTGWTPYGGGNSFNWTSTTGDPFGILGSGPAQSGVTLPANYISGSELQGSAFVEDETLASLGIVAGTYQNFISVPVPPGADPVFETITIRIAVPSGTLPGDFNGDGTVDLLDLDILGASFGGPGDGTTGDANGDGTVDLLDLDILGANFRATASATIPEPTTLALTLLATMVAVRRR